MTDQPASAAAPVPPAAEHFFDTTIIVTLPERGGRGRIVRLGPVLDTILSAHAYPPVIERILAEALVLTALLGSTQKDPGCQMTLQAQTDDGVVDLLVCDYAEGALRGYIKFDRERFADAGPNPTLAMLFGTGYLAITFDNAARDERYQGIVPLAAESLAQAAELYFRQSEQLPTLVRIATRHDDAATGGATCVAGGLLLQYLPEGEEGQERLHVRAEAQGDAEPADWAHLRALAETIRGGELVDPALSMQALLWRLFHDDAPRVSVGAVLSRGCRCSADYYAHVLRRFPAAERAELADDDGLIRVDCAFCSRLFPISAADLADGAAVDAPTAS